MVIYCYKVTALSNQDCLRTVLRLQPWGTCHGSLSNFDTLYASPHLTFENSVKISGDENGELQMSCLISHDDSYVSFLHAE